ncbi:MAG: PadR family transcriptional regulator, partial [Thermotogaceae bacterium]|nr:PadR family transcriptional regulator [Thermotogaceae bacterium]
MNIRLVILGLLQRRPMHGYEIKQEIERGMGDWTDIAFGSIYFAISKLAEEQSISESGKEKVGNRPSRIIYTITEKGRQEFIRILRD